MYIWIIYIYIYIYTHTIVPKFKTHCINLFWLKNQKDWQYLGKNSHMATGPRSSPCSLPGWPQRSGPILADPVGSSCSPPAPAHPCLHLLMCHSRRVWGWGVRCQRGRTWSGLTSGVSSQLKSVQSSSPTLGLQSCFLSPKTKVLCQRAVQLLHRNMKPVLIRTGGVRKPRFCFCLTLTHFGQVRVVKLSPVPFQVGKRIF